MSRYILLASISLVIAGATSWKTVAEAQSLDVALIPQTRAEQAGLKRAWLVQTPMDATRSKLTHINLQSGLLLVVTDEGVLHVLDPETGLRQWSFQVGDRRFVAQSAGANSNYVSVANNVNLFVLERATGNLVFSPLLTGTPNSGPVLTENHVIVPLVKGQLEAYPLNEKFKDLLSPQYLPAAGHIISQPAIADTGLVWAGDSGVINGHQFGSDGPQFNVVVAGGVGSGPALFYPRTYVGTESGYVMAYDFRNGEEIWRFAAGSAVHQKPVILGAVMYVLPDDGGMFAVRPETGDTIWYSADPIQFVSASPKRVYAIDKFKQLAILDAQTGARVDTMRLPRNVHALMNDQSDRILLYTDDGLLQCLHETQLNQPQLYLAPKVTLPKKDSGDQKTDTAPAATPAVTGNKALFFRGG